MYTRKRSKKQEQRNKQFLYIPSKKLTSISYLRDRGRYKHGGDMYQGRFSYYIQKY